MNGHSTSALRRHIPELDGLRGIAVLLVCMSHYAHKMNGARWETIFFNGAKSGWIGVDLFFVLSGFLITGILLDTRDSPGYLRNFFARRILRIFPLYYCALMLYFCFFRVVHEQGSPVPHPGWLLLYGSNVFTALHGWPSVWVGHFWSLAVEEQFYIVWPFCVLLVPVRMLLGLCLALWAVAGALRWLLAAQLSINPEVLFVITPLRIDPLVAGATLAICVRMFPGHRAVAVCCRLFLILSSLLLVFMAIPNRGFFYWSWSPLRQAVGYGALAMACACAIGFSLTSHSSHVWNVLLRSSLLVSFGKYSYAIYVFHQWFDATARNLQIHPSQMPSLWSPVLSLTLYSAVQLAVSWCAAQITWNVLEKHALALKRHFETRETPQIMAATAAAATHEPAGR